MIYYTMIHSRNRMLGSILSEIYQSNKKELQQKNPNSPGRSRNPNKTCELILLTASLTKLFPPLLT